MSWDAPEVQDDFDPLAPRKAARAGSRPVPAQETVRRLKRLSEILPLMGIEKLREGQDSIIHNIIREQDVIGLLPTGHGKSLTYQLPTRVMEWRTLVVSPLLALLDDQVRSAQKKGLKAVALSSSNQDAQNAYYLSEWVKGSIDVLLTVPERLTNPQFAAAIKKRVPDMLVVDEAHVIDAWADNFRPAYSRIDEFISLLGDELKVVLALTATATPETEAKIRDYLGMANAKRICYMPERKNLTSEKRQFSSDYDLLRAVESYGPNDAIIIYCATVKNVESVTTYLMSKYGHAVTMYSGKLDANSKKQNQKAFFDGTARIMVATNAFGMGIDKADVRGVIHYNTPASVEALVQEQGRAGRDELPSHNIVLLSPASRKLHEFMIPSSNPESRSVQKVYKALLKLADSENKVDATGADIAFAAGISDMGIHAIMSWLYRYKVISKVAATTDLATVAVHGKTGNPTTDRYIDAVLKYGVGPRNALKVPIGAVASFLKVQPGTVYTQLRAIQKLSSGEVLTFAPPPKGYIQIKSDLSKVDFDLIDANRTRAFEKLDLLETFLSLDESKKHDWLKKYFSK